MITKRKLRSLLVCASALLLFASGIGKANATEITGVKIASSIVEVKSAVSIVDSMTKSEKAAKAVKEAEEKAKKEAEEKAKKDAEEKAQKEAEEKAKKEAEEKAAAEKAQKEADEAKAKAEADKARQDANEALAREQVSAKTAKLFDLDDFMFRGVIYWSGYKFTYYSEKVLPGGGLQIPGRHVNADGYVADEDGYIVLAGDASMGTVFETPFGYKGKIYDRGTVGNHLDVYISR